MRGTQCAARHVLEGHRAERSHRAAWQPGCARPEGCGLRGCPDPARRRDFLNLRTRTGAGRRAGRRLPGCPAARLGSARGLLGLVVVRGAPEAARTTLIGGAGGRARTLLPAGDGGRRGWGGRSAWPPAEPTGRIPSDSRPRPPRSQAPPPPAPGRAGPGSHFGQSFVMVLGPQEAAGEAWPVSAAPTSVPRASRRFRPPLRRARRRLPALRSPIAGAAASERPGMGLPPGRDPSGGGGGGSGAAAGGSSALRAPPRARPRPFRRGGGSRAPGGLRAGLGGRRPGPSSALIVSCLGGKFAEPDTAPLAARRVTEGRGGRGRG